MRSKIDQKARELVLKARLLRFAALIFAVTGLLIFLALYIKNIDGTLLSALTNPFTIFMVLIPFLPAAVLSWMASRLEKQYAAKYKK